MVRISKKQKPRLALLLNIVIAVLAVAVFLSGALLNAFTLLYTCIFLILFAVWLLSNLYLNDPGNFFSSLLNAIIGIILVLFFYFVTTAIFVGIVYFLSNSGYIGIGTYQSLLYVASLLPLSVAVFLYLMLYNSIWSNIHPMLYSKPYNPAEKGSIARQLGLGAEDFSLSNIGIGLMVFVIILCLELAVGLLSTATNVQVNTNVGVIFSGAPLWFLVFAAVIEPINEEIFFRGFLVPRLGIWPSAIIFGLAHYSYDSTFGIEVLAAFVFALVSGYVYKKTGSLYPGIVAHILINTIAALSIVGMGS